MHGAERERVDETIAQSPIMITTITLERLVKRGYESMLEHYKKICAEQTFMGTSFTQ